MALGHVGRDDAVDAIKQVYQACMVGARAEVERNPLIRLPAEMNLMCSCAAGATLIAGDAKSEPPSAERIRSCFRSFSLAP